MSNDDGMLRLETTPERAEALAYCFASDPQALTEVENAAMFIAEHTGRTRHDLLVTLGSGFSDLACELGDIVAHIPMGELLRVPVPTAEGHGTQLLSVNIECADASDGYVHALVATGRSHMYEGLEPSSVVRLSQVAAASGVRAAVLTNAGGCLEDWALGDVMAISDHVNLSARSPFTGASFVDIWQMWDADFRSAISPYVTHEGVYALLRGPEYQTCFESILLRKAGISMVGMSTVLEAIALHQLGVRVCGLSVVSDLSFAPTVTEHDDVIRAVSGAFTKVKAAIGAVSGVLIASSE